MDINAFNAAKSYGAAQKTLRPDVKKDPAASASDGDFNAAAKAVKEVGSTIAQAEQTASAFMVGKADPHSVVEALASAELAVETAVTLRNKVVEAYQELIRMPV